MALTNKGLKEILSEAGLDAEHATEAVRKIMEGHNATVDALKEREETALKERDAIAKERDAYKADAEKLAEVQKELDTVKGGDWENKYNKLKADTEATAAKAAKETALAEILSDNFTDAGAVKIKRYLDWDKVELDEKGAVKGKAALVKSLREEWPEHIKTTVTTGADIPNPPVNAAPSASFKSLTDAMKYANEHPGEKIDISALLPPAPTVTA